MSTRDYHLNNFICFSGSVADLERLTGLEFEVVSSKDSPLGEIKITNFGDGNATQSYTTHVQGINNEFEDRGTHVSADAVVHTTYHIDPKFENSMATGYAVKLKNRIAYF